MTRKEYFMATHPQQIQTLIVDDHPCTSRGLTVLFSEFVPAIQVVATAKNADDARRVLKNQQVDLVIMDIRLGSRPNGLDLTAEIQSAFPNLLVLICSLDKNPYLVKRAIEAGARGYVLKDASGEQYKNAIDTITAGGTYLGPPLPPRDIEKLTGREEEAMKYLAKDWSDEDIAKKLAIEETTVRTHCTNIMSKLGLRNRKELVAEAKRRYPPDLDD